MIARGEHAAARLHEGGDSIKCARFVGQFGGNFVTLLIETNSVIVDREDEDHVIARLEYAMRSVSEFVVGYVTGSGIVAQRSHRVRVELSSHHNRCHPVNRVCTQRVNEFGQAKAVRLLVAQSVSNNKNFRRALSKPW